MGDFAFRWLHLSDLHLGMSGQAHLWANLKHLFYDDLPRTLELAGGDPDVVVFSGDIAQAGSTEEFARATDTLAEIWERLSQLGSTPQLFAVPGNHDLVWPDETSMPVMLLQGWNSNPIVRKAFLDDESSAYRDTALKSLENFRVWYRGLPAAGIQTVETTLGLLPGDQAGRVMSSGHRVGLLGLNSTWLQLTKHARPGDLHVDALQMAAAMADIEGWSRQNDFNLVVTHHPINWLNADAVTNWKSEISPPGRFDIHLFGHMHEPSSLSVAEAGSVAVTKFQAPSMFGMETFSDGTARRIHGYAMGGFFLEGQHRSLKVWPRRLAHLSSGQQKLVPDQDFNLSKDHSFRVDLPPKQIITAKPPALSTTLSSQVMEHKKSAEFAATSDEDKEKDVLGRFRYHLAPAGAHAHVRKIEQGTCSHALEKNGVWLIADWGLSADEFLSSVVASGRTAGSAIYRIDFSEILPGDNLEDEVETKLGLPIQALSEHLSHTSDAMLILDDIDLGDPNNGIQPRVTALENLAQALIDYCPSLIVVMRTRSDPAAKSFEKVVIGALDEAEVATYIERHSDGGPDIANAEVVAQLYSLSGGVPERVDRALKSLQVVTISELMATDVDDDAGEANLSAVSTALRRSIEELCYTENSVLHRAFEMLQVLTVPTVLNMNISNDSMELADSTPTMRVN